MPSVATSVHPRSPWVFSIWKKKGDSLHTGEGGRDCLDEVGIGWRGTSLGLPAGPCHPPTPWPRLRMAPRLTPRRGKETRQGAWSSAKAESSLSPCLRLPLPHSSSWPPHQPTLGLLHMASWTGDQSGHRCHYPGPPSWEGAAPAGPDCPAGSMPACFIHLHTCSLLPWAQILGSKGFHSGGR